MHLTRFDEAPAYHPPEHFDMRCLMLQGRDAGPSDTLWLGMSQILPFGTSYSLAWNGARSTSSNLFSNYNPLLNSYAAFNVTQPLLRNRTIDQYREQLELTRKQRDAADLSLDATVVTTVRNVRNAYWDLVYARENLRAQQQALDLAKRALADNEKRVQIGTMAPIDIVQAQAEVASNEQGVIIADANIRQAQDNLRALILDPGTPDFWTVEFDPTDEPAFSEQPIDVDEAVRNALSKRSDLMSAKNSLEQSDVNIKYGDEVTQPGQAQPQPPPKKP